MHQDQLEGLAAFLAVAETASFTQAAQRLSVSTSAVSQAVRGLEQRLGVALFRRTTRSVSLTEAGTGYLRRVGPALREVESASEELGELTARPAGQLRLVMPRAAALIVMRPVIRSFLAAYPEVRMEVHMNNERVDIAGLGYDAGLHFSDHVDQDMISIPVGPPMSVEVLASPTYLARRGTPRHPLELEQHDCIGYIDPATGQSVRWEFARGGERLTCAGRGRLAFNDITGLVLAALDSNGIAYVINGYTEELVRQGRLVRVLEDWSTPLPGFSLFHPPHSVPQKLRVLIDYLKANRNARLPGDNMLPLVYAGAPQD